MTPVKFTARDKFRLYQSGLKNLRNVVTNQTGAPPSILWEMTQRCNFTCVHCTSHLSRDKIKPKDDLLAVATKIGRSDTVLVALTGGEPTIIPGIKEVIATLKQHGKMVSINTNAFLLDQFLDFFLEVGLDYLTVSLDSVDAATHDALRGKQGSYAIALENLARLRKIRKRGLPQIGIRGVVMKENFRELVRYVEDLMPYADDIKFQPIHDLAIRHEVAEGERVKFSAADTALRAEIDAVMRALARRWPESFDNDYYRAFGTFIFEPAAMYRQSIEHCIPLLLFSLYIKPDGNAYTCNQPIGNIYEQKLEEIWGNKKKVNFISNLCAQGGCAHPCWLHSSVIESPWPGKLIRQYFQLFVKTDPTAVFDFRSTALVNPGK